MSANTNTTELEGGGKPYLNEASAKKLQTIGLAVMILGLVACGAAFGIDRARAPFSYLTGFMWATTIGLGGLFFPIVWRLSKAGWPVGPRRYMEWLSQFLYVVPLLLIPIVVFRHDLYHHWMSEEAKSDPILIKKAKWLSENFWIARAFVYSFIWIGLAWLFRKLSFDQDKTGDKALTTRAQVLAAPAVLFFALSVSFAGFDWVMSLDPHWFSTIYGVYIFSAGAVTAMGTVGLITVMLRSRGLLGKAVTIEHQHDVGKMFFGFIVFWAYIAFSQFILIWYANIPEETIYYRHRWEHGWSTWSLLLFFGHFVVPFGLMLSRWAKRINGLFITGAVIMLVAHFVDMFWLVMPTFAEGHAEGHFSFSIVDILAWAGPAGVLFFVVTRQIAKGPLYAIRDPRVREASRMENI